MGKFGHYEKLSTSGKTSTFTIHSVTVNGKSPKLIGRFAGESNTGYYNQLLKRSFQYAQQVAANAVTAAMLDENRAEDRALYPEFVIEGWENVTDSKGKPVDFSTEDCKDFLESLPGWVFDEVRGHFSNPRNFAGTVAIETEQVEAKSKN